MGRTDRKSTRRWVDNMLNVLPINPVSNKPNGLKCYAKPFAKYRTIFIAIQNVSYLLFREFRCATFFSRNPTWPPSAFPEHVLRVYFGISSKEVIWPDTRRIVAFVANIGSWRQRTMAENPRSYVSGNLSEKGTTSLDFTVAQTHSSPNPQPASVRDLYFVPKSSKERGRKALRSEEFGPIVRPLDQFHRLNRVMLPAVFPARGRLISRG